MRVAVTDAAGLVGQQVVEALIADRHEVLGLALPGFEGSAGQSWPKTTKARSSLLEGTNCLLAVGLGSEAAPDDVVKHETEVIKAAVEAGVRRVVLLSSTELYKPAVTMRGSASETSDRLPFEALGAVGRAAQQLEALMHDLPSEVQVTVIRAPQAFGPGSSAALGLVEQILHSGGTESLPDRLQGVDAGDLAEVLVSVLHIPRVIGYALNVAGPTAVLMEDARAEIQRLYSILTDFKPTTVNLRPEYRYAAPIVDSTIAREVLPKRANTQIWVNLAQLVQRYVENERAAGRLPEVELSISPAKRAVQEGQIPLWHKVALVTGATDGIGRATALMLSRMGAKVIAVGRNEEAGAALVAQTKADKRNVQIEFQAADLTSQKDIKSLVEKFGQAHKKLDILVNNAGAAYAERLETEDGLEKTLALNTIAPFMLTQLLADPLRTAEKARVVNVNTNAHRMGRPNYDDLQSETDYHPMQVYATTKLYQVMLTRCLASQMEDSVAVHSIHPGSVRTEFETKNGLDFVQDQNLGPQARQRLNTQRDARRQQMISPAEAAAHVVNLAMSSEFDGLNGLYLDCAERVTNFEGAPISQEAWKLWKDIYAMCNFPPD